MSLRKLKCHLLQHYCPTHKVQFYIRNISFLESVDHAQFALTSLKILIQLDSY